MNSGIQLYDWRLTQSNLQPESVRQLRHDEQAIDSTCPHLPHGFRYKYSYR